MGSASTASGRTRWWGFQVLVLFLKTNILRLKFPELWKIRFLVPIEFQFFHCEKHIIWHIIYWNNRAVFVRLVFNICLIQILYLKNLGRWLKYNNFYCPSAWKNWIRTWLLALVLVCVWCLARSWFAVDCQARWRWGRRCEGFGSIELSANVRHCCNKTTNSLIIIILEI
jgi:hypothetical protein